MDEIRSKKMKTTSICLNVGKTKVVSTISGERHVEHPFAGRNTQQRPVFNRKKGLLFYDTIHKRNTAVQSRKCNLNIHFMNLLLSQILLVPPEREGANQEVPCSPRFKFKIEAF